tara:strand:- start:47 stop:538 length:492 start_codon:yes stop_codon:yes gene_type:complete
MKVVYVKDTNANDFEKEALEKQVFAKYFSPSCPACISMKDDWDNLCKDVYEKYNTDLMFAEIDPSGLKKLEQSEKIHSSIDYVPSIVFLNNGKKKLEYNGNRSKDDMIRFLLENGLIKPKMKGGKKTKKKNTRKSKKSKKIHRKTKNMQKKAKKAKKQKRKKL